MTISGDRLKEEVELESNLLKDVKEIRKLTRKRLKKKFPYLTLASHIDLVIRTTVIFY